MIPCICELFVDDDLEPNVNFIRIFKKSKTKQNILICVHSVYTLSNMNNSTKYSCSAILYFINLLYYILYAIFPDA